MTTSFSPNHFLTSTNFNYSYISNNPKSYTMRKRKKLINENKENITENTNINTTNINNYEKLNINFQKNNRKKKILKKKIEKKLNLDAYRRTTLKIFEPSAFNNTAIHKIKHKNKRNFINNFFVKSDEIKGEEKKINNYTNRDKNNFLIMSSHITCTNYKNADKQNRKKQNDDLKIYTSIDNESLLHQNKLIRNSNFSYISYKSTEKNIENKKLVNHFYNRINVNKSSKNFNSNLFSPTKLEIPSIMGLSIDNKKNFRIHSERRNYEIKSTINPDDFKIIKQIGFGSFGRIYKTLNIINNQKYVLKVMHNNKNNILYMQDKVRLIMDFENRTKCKGLIKIFGDACIKKGNQYFYYEVLELADRDWEQEILIRQNNLKYYSENELIYIMSQLVKSLSLLQKNHITHRDIKLQNILLLNNQYKICDFGEARKLSQRGVIIQPVRGSELFMSPIQFFGLEKKMDYIQHNTYKSDVFSLGMCILFAANLNHECLYDIRELTNMKEIKRIVTSYLRRRYSIKFINLLLILLEYEENNRPDFISLEEIITQILK